MNRLDRLIRRALAQWQSWQTKSKRIWLKHTGIGKTASSLSNPRFKKCMNGDVVDRRTGEVVSR